MIRSAEAEGSFAALSVTEVDRFDPAGEAELRRFLAGLPAERGACGEHDPRWLRVLEQGLGHRPMALVARDAAGGAIPGAIRGYLPMALVSGRLFGRFLVSLPYLNRAGIVAADEAAAAALLERAVRLADQHDAQYLELRHAAVGVEHAAITHERAAKVRMVLDLPGDADTLWRALDAKVRNQVRKGDKAGLTIRWGGVALLDAFYDVFAVNMRDLGTPVYPRRLFGCILEQFGDEAELAVVEHGGEPVAAALLVHDALEPGGTTQVPSASSLRAFNHTNANMWMYWRLLERAMERGVQRFDFGRSSEGSGTYRFKKQWGARAERTCWQVYLRRGELDAVRPDHPRYQRRIQAWQRLPVWVTRLVGPAIVRGIP